MAASREEQCGKDNAETPVEVDTRFHEGCGRQGPIRCIFLCIFHPIEGPKITSQFPEDFISKETFDAVSTFIMPKSHLHECPMTIKAFGLKILGHPVKIEHSRYERNVFIFNLCFACDTWSRTVQYEPTLKKLADYLTMREEHTQFVSKVSTRMSPFLANLLYDLNNYRQATILEGDTQMHLKIAEVRDDPPPVKDSDVPIVTCTLGLPRPGQPPRSPPPPGEQGDNSENLQLEENVFVLDPKDDWDLTTKQLLPYMNGYNHVKKIAVLALVDISLAKLCIQNLVYYGVVLLMPVLKFSNSYRTCPTITRLFREKDLQDACLAFITPDPPAKAKQVGAEKPHATISDAISILCALQHGTTLKSVCERFKAIKTGTLDVRRLVVFAQLHRFIRRVQRYPVYTGKGADELKTRLQRLFDGSRSEDEICCISGEDPKVVEHAMEHDPEVCVIWK